MGGGNSNLCWCTSGMAVLVRRIGEEWCSYYILSRISQVVFHFIFSPRCENNGPVKNFFIHTKH